jgi:two-component system, NtrC family, sensor kinase
VTTGGSTARRHAVPHTWWFIGGLLLLVPLLGLVLFLVPPSPPLAGAAGAVLIALGVLVGLAAGYGLSTARFRRGLNGLHKGLILAQDGNLKPVEVPRFMDPALDRLYQDYNHTITTLGGMFSLVEECQNRVLSERNRMNVVVQVLPAGLLGVDDNLYINTANRQAEILFGMRQRYLVGSSLFDILKLSDETREVLRDAFLYKQNIRNQVISVELDGKERWLSVNLSFVTEKEGEMAAVITLLDITDYKLLQETVSTREKLVAMGQLAAGVAHELNTPLGSILGYSQLLLDATDEPEKAARFAHVISDETKRCSRIIQNLLNYARKEQCQGDNCDVNTLVDEVVDTLISCRLKHHRITLERELNGRPLVDGGCGELDIVLTNLLVNSVQALHDVRNPKVRIRTEQVSGGEVSITVEDNGPGIPRELRARVFEPFFTTKDVGEGSGLGLSISHAMVTRRGGTLRYDTEYEEGARFIIRLPGSLTKDH